MANQYMFFALILGLGLKFHVNHKMVTCFVHIFWQLCPCELYVIVCCATSYSQFMGLGFTI